MVKDQIIQTMVTEALREQLTKEAQSLGLTMSAYLRTIIMSRETKPFHAVVQNTVTKGDGTKGEL